MCYSLIVKNSELTIQRQEWLRQSGWDKYLPELYHLVLETFLDRNFLTEFNNQFKQINRWFELAITKFIFDFYSENRTKIFIYSNNEKERKIKEYKQNKNISTIKNPDLLIKIDGQDFFIEVTHINKGITKTYEHIFNDGWNYSKVFYFILGLQKTVGDQLSKAETIEPIFCCLDGKHIIRYSTWDWLDAHIYLRMNNKIEVLKK